MSNLSVDIPGRSRQAFAAKARKYVVRVMLAVIFFLLPLAFPTYVLSLAIEVLLFALFAMSLDLLLGYTGLVSFGHAAFFGIGGYILAYIAIGLSSNLMVTVPVVLSTTAIAAGIIGFLVLRARGIYFLMLTLAIGQMLFGLAVKWTAVTGGSDGLVGVPRPYIDIAGLRLEFSNSLDFYYLVAISFLVSWWILHRLVNSPFGHTLRGIKENESRMRALGYNTWRFTMAAFVIAGVFAGLSGLLFTHFNWHAAPENLYYTVSGQVMMMVIIGGSGTLVGPILGAVLIRLLPSYASTYLARWQTLMGLIFMAFVLYAPSGIIGLKRYFRRQANNGDREAKKSEPE